MAPKSRRRSTSRLRRHRPQVRKAARVRSRPAKKTHRPGPVLRKAAVRPKVPPSLARERRTLIDEPEAPTERPVIAETAHPAARRERNAPGAGLTGGDLDANSEQAYASGDETPGGDNPTPDQDRVDDIGRALGVSYADEEELVGCEKVIQRDRHRWELDPASAEDLPDREEPGPEEEES